MIRFFDFIGDYWWIIALSVMFIMFLSFITGVITNRLTKSTMPIMSVILFYCIMFAIWAVILLVGVPALIKYLISVY